MARHLVLSFCNQKKKKNIPRCLPADRWKQRKAPALPVTVIRNNVVYGEKQFSGRCCTSTPSP